MYHPTGRVLTVLEILQFRPGITGAELAERLEVDVRSVRRYIEKLKDLAIPVEGAPGRAGGYRLRPGYRLPPLTFSEEEASTIVLALMGTPWLNVAYSSAAVTAALSKLTAVLPDAARERVSGLFSLLVVGDQGSRAGAEPDGSTAGPADGPCGQELLIDLNRAADEHRRVLIGYVSERGEESERVVEPYGVVGRDRRWYLVAYCTLRQAYRIFRIDRIAYARVEPTRFRPDPEFDYRVWAGMHARVGRLPTPVGGWATRAREELAEHSWGIRYRVRFRAERRLVEARLGSSTLDLQEEAEGVVLRSSTDSFAYTARELASTGLAFTVLEPSELTDAVRALGAQLLSAGE